MLQVLLVLAKKAPPPGRKLLVIGTSSAGDVLDSMGLADAFNVKLHVPGLRPEEVVRVMRALDAFELRDLPEAVEALGSATGRSTPMKKLLLWLEMARQEEVAPGGRIPLARWQQVLADLSS